MKTIGIYKIINKNNNKYYIGSSNFIERRWRDHKKMLRGNRHDNNHLQNAWNKYGEDSFLFEVINIMDEKDLIKEEQSMLDKSKNDKNCYNLSFIAGKIEMTVETRKKISIKNKGKIHSEETKKKLHDLNIGKYVGRNNGMYGKPGPNLGKSQSEETKRKIGLAHKGKVVSHETKKKLHDLNIGKRHSMETKQKMKISSQLYINSLGVEGRVNHGKKVSLGYKNMSVENRQNHRDNIKKSWIIRKLKKIEGQNI